MKIALGIAVIHQRFELSVLRYGAMAATALAVALLVRPGFVDPSAVSSIPIWNSMTFGFVIAIAALFAGARLFSDNKQERQAFEAGALILSFVLIALTIRHISGEGALHGPFAGIGEASAYAIAYLGMAGSSISYVFRVSRGRGSSVTFARVRKLWSARLSKPGLSAPTRRRRRC